MPLVREKKKEEAKATRVARTEKARVASLAGDAEASTVKLPPWRELLGKGPKEDRRAAAEAERPSPPAAPEMESAEEAEAPAGRPTEASAADAERPAAEKAPAKAKTPPKPSEVTAKLREQTSKAAQADKGAEQAARAEKAEIEKKAEKKAEKKVEKKVEEKAEEKVEEKAEKKSKGTVGEAGATPKPPGAKPAGGVVSKATPAPRAKTTGATPKPAPAAKAAAKPPPALRRARTDLRAGAVGPLPPGERVLLARQLAAASQGHPLPTGVVALLTPAEPGLADRVRVHTGGAAAAAAALLDADAFTLGTDIFFAEGRYAPQTREGQELLTHELAHAAQHLEGAVELGREVSAPGDAVEHEAERRAERWRALLTRADPTANQRPPSGETSTREREGRAGAVGGCDTSRDTSPDTSSDTPRDTSVRTSGGIEGSRHPSPGDTSTHVSGAGRGGAALLRRASDTAKDFLGGGYFKQKEGWGGLGGQVDGAMATDATATTQSFEAPKVALGPETATPAPAVPAPVALSVAGEIPKPQTEVAAAAPSTTAAGSAPTSPALGSLNTGESGDKSAAQAQFDQALKSVPTELTGVNTSPGAPPPVALDGAADPKQSTAQETAAKEQAKALTTQAKAGVTNGAGPEQVQPKSLHEQKALPPAPTVEATTPPELAGTDTYAEAPLTQEIKDATDEAGKAQLVSHQAEATGKLDSAAAEADKSRDAEVTKAKEQNAKDIADAGQKQDAAVSDARKDIDKDRADTQKKQDAELAKVDTSSEAERTKVEGDVEARRKEDDKKVGDEFKSAETEAQKEKGKAEQDAKAEKEKAEKDSKNTSWWDRAVSFIKEAFSALTSFINKVFDAAIAAINKVIDAAKKFATDLINKARAWVISALQKFGDFLKKLVTALLEDLFPELAKALRELIDAAVNLAIKAVNAIADALIKAVTALLDAIGAALKAILEAYRAAILAALAFAQAALTGDWAALGKMILEAVLKLAGIPPEDFYALIAQAMGAIDTIVNDPGAFVGNVINAVKGGFQGFADNFLEHLKTGFFTWLMGPLGELGIQMPKSWDLMGIFGLVLDVLGLNKAGIKSIIVEEFGKTAGEIFDFVWKYVEALVTGGVEALWAQIQQDLSMLWDVVVDGIKSYLIETIVKQAVLKIATMFNPAGALLNALIMVWNVYNFLRENIQRIWGVVTSIVNMIATIAAGNIDPAAKAVEGALASLIPIAISLLANLLGLGGITKKVKDTLDGLRGAVRNAIKKLIGKVKGLFKGGGGKKDEKKGDSDTAIGDTLTAAGGGETHTIHIERKGKDAQVIVQSTPTPAEAFVTELCSKPPRSEYVGNKDFDKLKTAASSAAAEVNVAADQVAGLLDAQASSGANAPVPQDPVKAKEQAFATAVSALLAFKLAEPVAGLHPVSRPSEDSATPGESHHVPAKGLGAAVGAFLKDLGARLTSSPEWSGDPDAAALAGDVAAHGALLAGRATPPGNGLSAIMLRPEAHTEGDGVHTIDGSGPVLAALATNPKTERIVQVKRKTATRIAGVTSYIAVNPQIPSWKAFLADVHSALNDPNWKNQPDAAPEKTVPAAELILSGAEKEFMDADESSKDFLADRVEKPSKQVLDKAVKDGYTNGRATVSAAMERAKDGTKSGRAAALASLNGHYGASWSPFRSIR